MLRTLELVDVGPAPRMKIDFGERLNVFAGDNGLGKSFVLDVLWWALSGTWADLPAWPRPGVDGKPEIAVEFAVEVGRARMTSQFHPEDQFWSSLPFFEGETPPQALTISARAGGGFAVWDPARNYYRQIFRPQSLQLRPPAYIFTPHELWNRLEVKGKTVCNGLIHDWVSWQQQHDPGSEEDTAFTLLRRTMQALSPHPDKDGEIIRPGKPTRVFLDDIRDFPTIDMGYGEVPVIHASAGVRRILSLAYLIVWAWREHVEASKLLHRSPVNNIVFLMDEVETHLHPEWQRRIVPSLLKVLAGLHPGMNVQSCLTTHAPLVLASLEPIFDQERDRFYVFDLDKGEVQLNQIPWVKQGDAVDWLLSEAFTLQQARSVEAERAIEDAEALMRGEEPARLKTREAIDAELHRLLADDDIFWPRWIVAGDSRT